MYLREYRREDLDALYALDQRCFGRPFRFSKAMMRHCAENKGAVVRLACEADGDGTERVLGFCIASLHEKPVRVGYVDTIDVEPGRRRSGIGRMLMVAVQALAREAGAQRMLLHVYTGNTAAMRMYEALGFRRVGREHEMYGPGLDAWLYCRDLEPEARRALNTQEAGPELT